MTLHWNGLQRVLILDANLGSQNNDCAPFIWTGTTDTDWSTGTNWNKGTVPASPDEVIIPTTPSGGNYPLVGFDLIQDDVTVEAGSQLNVAPGSGITIGTGGTITNNGTFTLKSDASGTAWLDDFTNAGSGVTYTGNITVETFVTTGSGLGQRYFGSPVNNATVQGLDGTYTGYPLGQIIPIGCDPNQLDPASPYSNLFQWDEDATFATSCVQEGWTAISAATPLVEGRGYSGWVNDLSIISFTGPLNTGDVDFVTTGVSGSAVANADGWHLLANPFTSPIDVVTAINSGFTSPQTYDGGSGPYSGTFNPILVSGNNLAVAQGFVAESTGPGTTFTASQANRFAGNEVWFKA